MTISSTFQRSLSDYFLVGPLNSEKNKKIEFQKTWKNETKRQARFITRNKSSTRTKGAYNKLDKEISKHEPKLFLTCTFEISLRIIRNLNRHASSNQCPF